LKYHPVYGISVPEKGWVPSPRYLLRRYRILHHFESFPRGNLLEIGCGAGALLHDLSSMGFIVEAFDISSSALEVAYYLNKFNSNVVIYNNIQKDWVLKFNYILSFEVLEHIEGDLDALKIWYSWLRSEGFLLLSVPAHPQRWNASDDWAGHLRRYERKELKMLIEQAGFELVRIECYGFPLANFTEQLRAVYHSKQLRKRLEKGNKYDQQIYTCCSAIERNLEQKLYALQACWPFTRLMQFFCKIQHIFSDIDLGNGFLALCKKK
jgi:2-polyprenyl-3-methyl-5-hydroxy-6-metoxy-1,4-benzoquinol methylase